jgi:hypothetical protein
MESFRYILNTLFFRPVDVNKPNKGNMMSGAVSGQLSKMPQVALINKKRLLK